jgi:hypothetical protein
MTLGPDHTEGELAEVVLVRGFEEEDGLIDKVLDTVWEHLNTTWAELTGHIRLFFYNLPAGLYNETVYTSENNYIFNTCHFFNLLFRQTLNSEQS